jgi:hypothetical protein
MKKYFVVDRYRCNIDTDYVKEFLEENDDGIKFHDSSASAFQELHKGFYDDSDYDVFSINDIGKIERISK